MVRIHKKRKELVRDYILLIAGTGLMALAIQAIFDPMGMVTGGFTGIGILIRRATMGLVPGGIPLWLTNILLNLPAFTVAWFVMGRAFVCRTAVAAFLLSLWLGVIPPIDLAGGDYLLASVYGGLLTGAGISMVFRTGNATGGTDLLASLLHRRLRRCGLVYGGRPPGALRDSHGGDRDEGVGYDPGRPALFQDDLCALRQILGDCPAHSLRDESGLHRDTGPGALFRRDEKNALLRCGKKGGVGFQGLCKGA